MPHLIYGGESDQLIKVRTVPLGGAEVVLDIPDRVRTHEDEVRVSVYPVPARARPALLTRCAGSAQRSSSRSPDSTASGVRMRKVQTGSSSPAGPATAVEEAQ